MGLPWMQGRDIVWLKEKAFLAVRHPAWISKRMLYNSRRRIYDCASVIGLCRYPYRIIFLAGMALSGSTWIKNMLARIPGYFTRATPMPRDVAARQDIVDSAFSRVPGKGYTLFKTHLNPTSENLECVRRNGVEKIIVSYRDLRDVVVSDYHRSLEFPDPYDSCGYVDYSKMSKEEAMACSIGRIEKNYIPWIRDWMKIAAADPARYHFVRFEDLKSDPHGEFKKMLGFYGIDLGDKTIDRIIEETRGRGSVKENMRMSKVLPWGYGMNFRSGKVGSWKEEFSERHIAESKKLLGEILIELEYEKDNEWRG